MKLHLTATSERGKPITKSGNDWLKIEVVNEDREIIFTKTFTVDKLKLKGWDWVDKEFPRGIK